MLDSVFKRALLFTPAGSQQLSKSLTDGAALLGGYRRARGPANAVAAGSCFPRCPEIAGEAGVDIRYE
jgi:hypothetical protein